MRNFSLLLLVSILLLSCGDKQSNNKILYQSNGNINNITVVLDNEPWKGRIGEAIRDKFAAPVDGLPQDEPLFSMNQLPPSVFSDFVTKSRLIIKIEKGKQQANTKIANNVFAKPQKVAIISGITNEDIINEINTNAGRIIKSFKEQEIKERQRRTKKSILNTELLKENLGVKVTIPSAYRIAKQEHDFFWIRRDIRTGTVNLMFYELPISALKENDNTINQIIKIRDSIGKTYIPGPTEGSHLITEKAYSPFFTKAIIDNKSAFETKSTWEVKGAFMAGPFINYAIKDETNDRYLIAEGFVFAPSVQKREYMFEVESIIKSIVIN